MNLDLAFSSPPPTYASPSLPLTPSALSSMTSLLSSSAAPSDWHVESWRSRPISQQPEYKDTAARDRALETLRRLPPLVHHAEVDELRHQLSDVAAGHRFFLQGGDCAERFQDCSQKPIEQKFKILLQMSLILTWGARLPTVRIGRVAGQYGKPRSSPVEKLPDGSLVPSFKGDNINGFEPSLASRQHDPARLIDGHFHSAATLNYIRALIKGGYADLHQSKSWDLGGVVNRDKRTRYQEISKQIVDGLDFMEITGIQSRSQSAVREVDFFTSHEGLVLDYESAVTKQVPNHLHRHNFYNLGAHFLWIGNRTRALDCAHVEYFRGIRNPIGIKVDAELSGAELITLLDRLDPAKEPGKLTLITRFGADKIWTDLPKLIQAVQNAGRQYTTVWACDPMHGNTYTSSNGLKTRSFDAILSELKSTFEVHEQYGSHLGGVHFELTGENVTECVGGPQELAEAHLPIKYETYCLAAGSFVTLADQTSVPIESIATDAPTSVLSYDPAQDGCVVKETQGQHLLRQGLKECVELVLEDGRKLVCTADHRVRTRRGDVEVRHLTAADRVIVAPEGPRVQDSPVAWALQYDIVDRGTTSHVVLSMADRLGHARCLAFARVLGYLITDGNITTDNHSKLYMGHRLDAESIRRDIALVLGCAAEAMSISAPKASEDDAVDAAMDENSDVNAGAAAADGPAADSCRGNNTYDIKLPRRLVRVMKQFGCPVGKKLGQGVGLPAIVLRADTPKAFVREFLGAMYGGDGSAPLISSQSASSRWTAIKFHVSVFEADCAAAVDVFERELRPLLSAFGVDGEIHQRACTSSLSTPGTWQIEFICPRPAALVFAENIGFRHCVHKIVRLSVACSWYRAVQLRVDQRARLIDAAKQERAAAPVARKDSSLISWDDALQVALDTMPMGEVALSGIVPSAQSIRGYIRGDNDPMKCRGMYDLPWSFVGSIGARKFFNAGKATTASSSRVYAVARNLDALPTWHLGVAGVRPVGLRQTFDLSVKDTHLFVADGVVVHNCDPRLNYLQAMEMGFLLADLLRLRKTQAFLPHLFSPYGYSAHLPFHSPPSQNLEDHDRTEQAIAARTAALSLSAAGKERADEEKEEKKA